MSEKRNPSRIDSVSFPDEYVVHLNNDMREQIKFGTIVKTGLALLFTVAATTNLNIDSEYAKEVLCGVYAIMAAREAIIIGKAKFKANEDVAIRSNERFKRDGINSIARPAMPSPLAEFTKSLFPARGYFLPTKTRGFFGTPKTTSLIN